MENKKEFTIEEIRKALGDVFYKDLKVGTGEIGIKDCGNGWFSISTGKNTIWTNAEGVENFNKAMREEAEKFLKD